MWAIVHKGVVTELHDTPQVVHSDLTVVEVPPSTTIGMVSQSDGSFARPPMPPDYVLLKDAKKLARTALANSDAVVLECYEKGIPVPNEWVSYRDGLRDLIAAPLDQATAILQALPPATIDMPDPNTKKPITVTLPVPGIPKNPPKPSRLHGSGG